MGRLRTTPAGTGLPQTGSPQHGRTIGLWPKGRATSQCATLESGRLFKKPLKRPHDKPGGLFKGLLTPATGGKVVGNGVLKNPKPKACTRPSTHPQAHQHNVGSGAGPRSQNFRRPPHYTKAHTGSPRHITKRARAGCLSWLLTGQGPGGGPGWGAQADPAPPSPSQPLACASGSHHPRASGLCARPCAHPRPLIVRATPAPGVELALRARHRPIKKLSAHFRRGNKIRSNRTPPDHPSSATKAFDLTPPSKPGVTFDLWPRSPSDPW